MILIFGNGYLGNKLNDFLDDSQISSVDITDPAALAAEIEKVKPTVIINCAGKTGRPNIDWCEDHKIETLASNVTGPLQLLNISQAHKIYLVHIGSGCIYQGNNKGNGFTETDPPNFFDSFYSKTKIWAETMLKEFPVLQLRLRMPVDSRPNPRNLIDKITKYSKVISEPNSVTIIDDFLQAAKELIDQKSTGIFNLTNPGAITHQEILDLYRELIDPKFKYEIMSLDELAKVTKAARSNCVLNTDKLSSAGISMRPIQQAIRETLVEYSKQKN